MIIKTHKTIPTSEITDPLIFKNRRQIIKALAGSLLIGTGISSVLASDSKVT